MRDWKVVPNPLTPIGDPFYACYPYMSAFIALESFAMMRLTDQECEAYKARDLDSAYLLAGIEIERRRLL